MMFLVIFTDDRNQLPALSSYSPGLRQFLIVLGATTFVSLALLVWAVFIRKRRGGRERRRRRHHRSIAEKTAMGVGEIRQAIDKRNRRRRRERRPRNPTLAQTGGLPPVREDDSPPPQAPEAIT